MTATEDIMKHVEKTKHKAKLFLTEPADAFKKERKTELPDTLRYFMTISVVFAILESFFTELMGKPSTSVVGFDLVIFLTSVPTTYIALIIGVFIVGLIVHFFAYAFGARKGLNQTIKAVTYSYTPAMLLGWIPFVGPLFSLWAIVLMIIGIKDLQGMTMGRAALAVIVPLLILVTLFVLGVLMLIMAAQSVGMGPAEISGIFSDPSTFPAY